MTDPDRPPAPPAERPAARVARPHRLPTQAQIARAVKAVTAAGLTPTQVQVAPDGTVTVATGPAGAAALPPSPLDAWLARDTARRP